MAILKYFKQEKVKEKFNEQLEIEGAEFVGSAYGKDVYIVTTWAAAQQIEVKDESDKKAGKLWFASEEVFNRHINDIKFYVFVNSSTNKAELAAIKLRTTDTLKIALQHITFRVAISNYMFRDYLNHKEINNDLYPLFLLPDIQYPGHDGVIEEQSGEQKNIIGTYNGFINPSAIPNEVVLENINVINSHTFKGYSVPTVVVENSVKAINSKAFEGYTGQIRCGNETFEETQYWAPDWAGDNTNIIWGIHLTPEEIARREEELRQRQEAERREREFQTQDAINVLKYRDLGNEITIVGVKRRRENLNIPAEINGKPVTKIAPFAFYNNQALNEVTVPDSVTEIGKGAFYGCSNARISYPRTATVFANAFTDTYRTNAR